MLILLCGFAALMGVTELGELLAYGPSPADVFVPPMIFVALLRWQELLEGLKRLRLEVILLSLYLLQILLSTVVHHASPYRFFGAVELAVVFLAAAIFLRAGEQAVPRAWIRSAFVLAVVAIAGSLLSVAGVTSYFTYPTSAIAFFSRAKGLSVSPNQLASFLLVPLLLLAVAPMTRVRNTFLSMIGICLVLTVSRTLLAAAFVLTLVKLPQKKLISALFLALAFASVIFQWGKASEPFHFSASHVQRRDIAVSALETIALHPVSGVGPDALVAKIEGWPEPGAEPTEWRAHDTALDVAGMFGLPALLFLAGFLFLLWRRSAANPLFHWILCGFLFDSLTSDIESFRHFWLFLGLLAATSAKPGDFPEPRKL